LIFAIALVIPDVNDPKGFFTPHGG
jgi:hypothetical protein